MTGLLLVGFAMVLISVWFSYKEFMEWWEACNSEKRGFLFPFKCLFKHTGKLVPLASDIVLAVFLSSFMGFGGGVIGGITGLFFSNCISGVIFYHTHIKNHKKLVNNDQSNTMERETMRV